MNGFERVHECVGGYTDAGQYEVHPNEPIVDGGEFRFCPNCGRKVVSDA